VAATAVVSESALVYIARHRNLLISLSMLLLQAALSVAFIQICIYLQWGPLFQAAAVAAALMVALAYASVVKAIFLSKLLDAPVNGWRWTLMIAVGVASAVGYLATRLPEWAELIVGIPMILGSYAWVIWKWGFGPEDRKLFKMKG
jgi:hypothetical protein